MINIDYSKFKYELPKSWYEGLYVDKVAPCKAGRPFCLLNEKKSSECWVLVHGYRGYPGELVRPAYDLYLKGFDIYVVRLPGCGTSGNDFIRSSSKDWLGVVENAIKDLKTKYQKVNLLGHSLGSSICGIVSSKNKDIGKIIYAAPGFGTYQVTATRRLYLTIISPFVKKMPAPWKRTNTHHHYYEDAPCDEDYLGNEYYKWHFTSKLIDCFKISEIALKEIVKHKHENLIICPLKDKFISVYNVEQYKELVKDANIIEIENGTHLIFYDIDEKAEEDAVKAVVDYALK